MLRLLLSSLVAASSLAAEPARAEPFRGENCRACHARIRDRTVPALPKEAEPPEESFDVVVVGGGFAGLSAAYFLRDLKVLVLEKEERAGGHGQSDSWRGIPYATASVYYNNKPYGIWADLFRELGLKPIAVAAPQDSLVLTRPGQRRGEVVQNFLDTGIDALPYSPEVKEGFRRLKRDVEQLTKTRAFTIPVMDSKKESWKYDETVFWDYLAQQYGETVATYAGRFVQDMLGAGPKEISAFAGITMLCSGEDYFTWEGGLNPVVKALEDRLPGRVRTGALVTRVEQDRDGVSVSYERGGKTHRVRAKAAVLAIASHVIRRIFQGIPEDKDKALSQVRYSAYVVTMLGFREPVWRKSYMLWSENTTRFTSLLFTDWPVRAGQGDSLGPQVGLAYTPLGSEEERRRLLNTTDKAIKERTLSDLETVLPGASAKVEEARVIRWGHAEPIPYPGYLSRVRPLVAQPVGRVFFAGEATEIPAMEGAIFSAHRASQEVRRFLGQARGP